MKIITDNAVYVQKNDIVCLSHSDLSIPSSIFMKVFGNDIVIIDDSNRYDFVEFNDQNDIEFFKGIDWIIDYDEIKDLTEEDLLAQAQSMALAINDIQKRFNFMSLEEREQNVDMLLQCRRLDFKISSLRDILWFKQGHIKMQLPEGVDLPSGFFEEKGVRKLLKNMFGKKNK